MQRRWMPRRKAPETPQGPPPLPERSVPERLAFSILPVDKPSGPTSHDVVLKVARTLGVRKAGHGGTLDAGVTGVLPVFLGRATRLSSLLLASGKEYVCTARFHRDVTAGEVEEGTRPFLGTIRQLPPVRSRVKRRVRTRSIHALEVLSVEGRDAVLRVSCQAGTYIRKLVHDLGASMGVGAHMHRLRRTRSGPYRERDAVSLETLAKAARTGDEETLRRFLHPGEELASLFPRLVVDEGAARAVAFGTALAAPGLIGFEAPFEKGDEAAVLDEAGRWIALVDMLVDAGTLAGMERGLAARIRRVLAPRPSEGRPSP